MNSCILFIQSVVYDSLITFRKSAVKTLHVFKIRYCVSISYITSRTLYGVLITFCGNWILGLQELNIARLALKLVKSASYAEARIISSQNFLSATFFTQALHHSMCHKQKMYSTKNVLKETIFTETIDFVLRNFHDIVVSQAWCKVEDPRFRCFL